MSTAVAVAERGALVINAISYRFELVKAMDAVEEKSPGTIYFPVSFVIAILLFWDVRPLVVASLMPLTLGDAFAAMGGRAAGRTKYMILGRQRSVEGSAGMCLFSFLGVALALWVLPTLLETPILVRPGVLLGSLIVALAATIVEALTPWNLDNLTVPAISMLALALLVI